MTRRQSHRKPTYPWRHAMGFAMAYTLVMCVTVVAVACVGVMFSDRAATAIRYLPAVLGSLAALVRMARRF